MAKKKDKLPEVIGFIDPRPARRITAVSAVGLLGTIQIYIAATHPPRDFLWLLFLVVLGAACIYAAWRMWVVTGVRLELTKDELREKDGRVLFTIDEVAHVDRGFFAFKPANGFQIRLKEKTTRGRVYAPGLWWRAGRMIMVGGVVSGRHAKAVADLIKVLLLERDNDMPGGLQGKIKD